MSIDKQTILRDLNLKQTTTTTTPLMFSRDSSMDTLSSFNVNFHSHNSTYTSDHSTNPSGILSPSDIPDSPPRGRDDSINTTEEEELLTSHEQLQQQQTLIQPLNNTRSTGITVIERSNNYIDDDDHDSIRNYAVTSPIKISYDGDDDDDDNNSIHSSLSSLTLPPPTSTSTARTLLTNLNELKRLKHNLSVINEESLHEQNERRKSIFNLSNTTTDDDDDNDNDQKGKRLLLDLIRQRLPHHHISLTNPSNSSTTSSSKMHDEQDLNDISKTLSSSSPSVIDQTMREHDLTLPSSSMQESGYDSLLPMGSAPKRSLSNASLSTTRSITIKKKHRCDEENDDPMNGNHHQTDITDDDDEHYDKKAGEALLRNLIAQVLPSFNPRYLNGTAGDDDNDEDEILSNPRRPSPTSQAYSSSTASSVRSIDIEINKKTEKNISIRSNKTTTTGVIQQEKIQCKRTNLHRPVQQTKTSELRRLQTQSRR